MRRIGLMLVAATCLAACASGGGAGSSADGCGSITSTGGCTPAPSPAPTPALLLKSTTTTTYAAAGGGHQVSQQTQSGTRVESFASELTDAASDKLSVTYNPLSDAFTVKVNTRAAGASVIFDDPLYRTAFGGARQPQPGVPQLSNYLYLQRGPEVSSGEIQTFFYRTPGDTTRYVTLAGFVRSSRPASVSTDPAAVQRYSYSQSAEVFGILTPRGGAPATGRATYRGDLLATAIYNTELDTQPNIRSRLEWIQGQASLAFDFSNNSLSAELSGTFLDTADPFAALGAANASNAGRSFFATGAGTLSADHSTFTGSLSQVSVGGTQVPVGASALNGAFYGPTGQEIGGGFRIVGSGPDQRVEIIGAFTGAK